ncbi:MAG: AAA family ATPase [Lachnospiraceae bacterium]|nr:AAA family ATPase [Lachnospiraceae bacterium]
MIRMTKVKLINWHNFIDDIISFKNITYLIGINATGKTTIMDAIRYCLTTNKDFNTAGNKKSARSLQGSVHQKQRGENSYLRPEHTVTYIGIEFLDESIDKTFVISVRIESEQPYQELRHVSQDWYISKSGFSLTDMPYFTTVKDGRRPAKKEEFMLENRGLDRAPSQAEARRRICRVLGIGEADSQIGKKFNQVFHMGTSLDDIDDIRNFIYAYILPEPEINVDILHRDMRELERLQEVLEEAQIRERLLAEILDKITVAKELDAKVKVNEALVCYAKLQDSIEKLKEKEDDIGRESEMLGIYDRQLDELDEKEKDADEKHYQARSDLDNKQENKALLYLTDDVEKKKKEYSLLTKKAAKFDDSYTKLVDLLKQMAMMEIVCQVDVDVIGNLSAITSDRITAINQCKEMFGEIGEEIRNSDAMTRNQLNLVKDEITDLVTKISVLETGTMRFPREAELIKNAINEKLTELGKEPEAKVFCELLYMNEPIWQDAVESYLNQQRFNIIVNPKHYDIAKKVFISLRNQVGSIGLIDTVRLMRSQNDLNLGMKTLSQVVESKNPYARAYADYLMGRVVCCENEDELELNQRSVTKDLLRYQNYCIQRMPVRERYIGIDALQEQLKNARESLEKKRLLQAEYHAKKEKFIALDKKYQWFAAGNAFVELEENCEAGSEAEKLFGTITEIKAQIEEFEKNPLLRAMHNRVEECKKVLEAIKDQITTVKSKKINAEEVIKNAKLVLMSLQINIDNVNEAYTAMLITHAQYIDTAVEKFNEERKSKLAAPIAYNFGNQINQGINSFNNYINAELLPMQRKYTGTYACDYAEGIEDDKKYQTVYYSLLNIDLESHRDELKKAQELCKERFRKEILFRMKDDILRAKQQFRQLNKVMGLLHYGEESYRFLLDGSKDKELLIFYNIIMDKDNQQIDAGNEIMEILATGSEVFESQIDEFMQRIMVDVENHAQQNITGKKNNAKQISAYVDYRTYLDYDIIVRNFVTKLEVPLSKVSGDGSGGENQAPFYVAICASLLQIYQQSDNCIRLILLDEAFNNMTSDRIGPMMKMFKELNLQLILIATPEKCTSIFPYCDITYSIVKSGSRNALAVFEGI